ncbi:GH39 family glycosyl hydrolase [Mucisphaera sp.]|uniref:GH39 family glycosyl hydrolase n=1 Tax=Mucisphaera sp. TaxID=2913024 RepID=UPI003D1003FC
MINHHLRTGHLLLLTSLLLSLLLCSNLTAQQARFAIDLNHDTGPLPHFWRSTGFSPATLIEDPRMHLTLAHLDGVPHRGIAWARVHFLLELVTVTDLDTETPTYDWSRLDRALDQMLQRNIRPFFELMGSPQGFTFTDMHDDAQVNAWRRFVRDLARHLIDRYGAEEVRSWYFEVWNEPEWPKYFRHPWQADDPAGLIRYYDASSAGLMDADPQLIFGGPGTALTLSDMFTHLMRHLDTGTNHLTGQSPPRCDFISIHEKGGTPQSLYPDTNLIFERQNTTIAYLREHHPRLATLPFINNECDPIVGWREPRDWRGNAFYASWLAYMVTRQLDETIRRQQADLTLVSHDYAFLGDWTHRSVLVPFAADPNQPDTNLSMVKKPVLEATTALALLGDRTLQITSETATDTIHALATRSPAGDIVILLANHHDDPEAQTSASVELQLNDLPEAPWKMATRRIDPDHTNPMAVWLAAGSPDQPTPTQLDAMREAAEIHTTIADLTTDRIQLDLPTHSLVLITLTTDTGRQPQPVTQPRLTITPGLHGPEALVTWSEASNPRQLAGYQVEALTPTGWTPLHETKPIATTLLRPLPDQTEAIRITAIDLWGRTSESVIAASTP